MTQMTRRGRIKSPSLQPIPGKPSIAAHVDHVHFGLSLLMRWLSGEENPWLMPTGMEAGNARGYGRAVAHPSRQFTQTSGYVAEGRRRPLRMGRCQRGRRSLHHRTHGVPPGCDPADPRTG